MNNLFRYILSMVLVGVSIGSLWADEEPFNPSDPPEPMVQYAVGISASPAEGTASISMGGMFAVGKVLTISVSPASDYVFRHWTLNGVEYTTARSFDYTVGDSAVSFVAVLALKPLITVSVSPEEAGSAYGGGRYAEGSNRRIYTYGNEGYTFLHWTLNGEIYEEAGENTSFYYTLGIEDVTFVAVYKEPEPEPEVPFEPEDPAEPEVYYRLDVTTNLPSGIAPSFITQSTYSAPGKNISLITTTPEGYVFQHWTLNDVLYSDQTSCPYLMGDSNVVFTAHFAKMRSITLTVNPSEAGSVSGAGLYAPNTRVLITTSPREGYTFLYWTRGEEVYAETLSFYYIVNAVDASFEAVYQKIETPVVEPDPEDDEPFIPSNPPEPETEKTALLITVGVNDPELGEVTGLPTDAPLFAGDVITLTATPSNAEEFYFLHWADGNTDNPREITLTVDARYVAVFARQSYTITFYDEDSLTILDQRAWEYGALPTCISPAKPSDEEYSYRFLGWQPTVVTVTQDADYYATYERLPLEQPTSIDEVQSDKGQCTKVLRNGVMLIERGDKIVTLTGQQINRQ